MRNKIFGLLLCIVILYCVAYFGFLTGVAKSKMEYRLKQTIKKKEITLSEIDRFASGVDSEYRYTIAVLFYKYSKECVNKEITPQLLYAIAKTESNFNVRARSKVGALGLMQIKYSTAKWLKEKYKLEKQIVNLYDLDSNIYYSVKYLDFLCSYFKKKGVDRSVLMVYVIIAYNEGQNAPIIKGSLSSMLKHRYLRKVLKNRRL